ncbi:multi protein-bridging factor 1 [Dioszegia hungarica]|uniref:Multi protein-bridging factor 1 n=1 Tax=Dioszegia hungarica TaxID=4972 RepID=A0AA38H7C7_9TREE|nr:multi protein-bridging factor 1 [Dioszegia hungarica]KAI9635792.1 multi protein-bridging factor 1 [Dioszegia hungarica]
MLTSPVAQRSGAAIDTSKTQAGQSKGPADHGRIAKLDRDDAPKPPEKIDGALGRGTAGSQRSVEAGGGGDGSFISSGIGADQNSVGKALAQARAAKLKPDGKSMTQKELATAVNAKPQDIADIETARAVPNQQLLGKLERIVGVKLRGAASLIGTPLGGPKK